MQEDESHTALDGPDAGAAPSPPAGDGRVPGSARATDIAGLKTIHFHQLVTLVELQRGAGIRVGSLARPEDESVRFRATRSLGFGASDISSVTLDEAADQLQVRVNFFGLYGPASPLPPYYTERIIEEDQDPSAVEDLFDLFNHRLVSLLHVIWRKYRYYLRYEADGTDALSKRFLALCGFPVEDRERIRETPRSSLLPHIGLMSLYASSADVVAATLANFFGVPCRIEEFVPRRVVIDEAARLRLGSANAVLGEDAILGRELDDDLGKFRICLGRASFDALAPFLPSGARHRQFGELLTMVNREPLEWDVEYDLEPDTVPMARLGECRLGWSSWLAAQNPAFVENRVHIASMTPEGTS